MASIEGTCRKEFQAVRDVFEYHLDSTFDIGASVAVFIDGEPAVDLWGGYFDATYTRARSTTGGFRCWSKGGSTSPSAARFSCGRC